MLLLDNKDAKRYRNPLIQTLQLPTRAYLTSMHLYTKGGHYFHE
jgi:hypothetical protein